MLEKHEVKPKSSAEQLLNKKNPCEWCFKEFGRIRYLLSTQKYSMILEFCCEEHRRKYMQMYHPREPAYREWMSQ